MTYANFGSSHPGSHPIFSWLWSRWTGLPGRPQPATSSRHIRLWRSGTLRGRSVWWWQGPSRPGRFATTRPRQTFEPWVVSRVIGAAAGPAASARPVAGHRALCAQSVTGITSCAPVAKRKGSKRRRGGVRGLGLPRWNGSLCHRRPAGQDGDQIHPPAIRRVLRRRWAHAPHCPQPEGWRRSWTSCCMMSPTTSTRPWWSWASNRWGTSAICGPRPKTATRSSNGGLAVHFRGMKLWP